jgi:type III secretion protein C
VKSVWGRLQACAISLSVAAIAGVPAIAAPIPESQTAVSIAARDQPIGAFIRDLFGRLGRPVVASPNLTGTVNGTFNGPIDKIFSDIAKAFNLVGYYDGAAIYIYAANELTVQTLPVGPGVSQRVLRQVAAQRLANTRNIARSSTDGNLVISGTPRFVEQVTALAQGGGAAASGGGGAGGFGGGGGGIEQRPPVTPLEFRVFYLRYARAEDMTIAAGGREVRIPGLATIIQNLVLDQRPGGSAGTTSGAPAFGARLVRQSQPRLKGLGLDAVAPDYAQTSTLGLATANVAALAEAEAAPSGGEVPVGSADVVRIEANPSLNAIIVRDVPERMASYDTLIRALDVEPQLVEIEATIIDIDTQKLRKLGINWRLSTGGFGFLLGDGTANDLRLLPSGGSRRDNTNNITPSALGGTISTVIGSSRQVLGRINALEQKGAARVVSRPQVMTLSNVEAVFDRTQTFYVRVAGRAEVDLFNVTTGTVLRVNPHVFRDRDQNRIRMMVDVQDGSIAPGAGVDDIPIVERASVSTQAMVVDGESLLLGGMTVDSSVDNEDRIPLLGDIPLVGNLFKTRAKQRQHTERLFLITPRVASLGAQGTVAAAAREPAMPAAVAAPALSPTAKPVPTPTGK